ncbi:coenzyme Q-binding protein COQ10, mitochondrial isoform X2 [Harpegnathos saltator]|uniref:coenzyme Q-binding protein COQ10, mitochondrial isoform X2 n=1 Tax=Harpegnathos saltator TaxID=610380 RepID=UPI00058E6898|nr:coenzyme Q-binding protein COQ10, mitochondrial isoform X2 [Harpegnathos saltator]
MRVRIRRVSVYGEQKHVLFLGHLPLSWKYNIFKLTLRCLYKTQANNRIKEYEGRKLVGFSAKKMFYVVSDVENYKEFLPYCKKSDITLKTKDLLKANLVIGFPPINESYTSKVTMVYPRLVKAESKDGRLFNHLDTLWIFTSGLKNNPDTCVIDFSLSFEFKSVIYSHLSNLFFNEIVRQMENAFLEEAKRRYGQPCLKAIQLQR